MLVPNATTVDRSANSSSQQCICPEAPRHTTSVPLWSQVPTQASGKTIAQGPRSQAATIPLGSTATSCVLSYNPLPHCPPKSTRTYALRLSVTTAKGCKLHRSNGPSVAVQSMDRESVHHSAHQQSQRSCILPSCTWRSPSNSSSTQQPRITATQPPPHTLPATTTTTMPQGGAGVLTPRVHGQTKIGGLQTCRHAGVTTVGRG